MRHDAIAGLAARELYLGTSHRREPVRAVVASIREGLADLYRLPTGYEVVLGVGGTTAFWDGAAFCLISQQSQHAVFGEFSSKFADVVARTPHLMEPERVEAPPGGHPELEPVAGVDAYALTHNETSTGVAMPVRRPDQAGLVLVDATSAAGAMEVDALEFDVYYFSPQKAFGSEGGLWVALMSPAAVDRIDEIARSDRAVPAFLDLHIAVGESRKNQTYNTPALATLGLLSDQVDWMRTNGGLEATAATSRRNSTVVYDWALRSSYASPFVANPDMRSPTVVTVDLEDGIDAATVSAVLRSHGVVDTEGYRKLGRNQLRLAAFPAIDLADLERVTRAIDYIVDQLGA